MKIDKEMVELVKSIGEAIKDLPEAVQARAFEVLLARYLEPEMEPPLVPTAQMPSPAVEEHWAARLAQAAGVRHDQVQHLLSLDENGLHVITQELGNGEAERNKNIAILLAWASRVLNRDIYYPTTEVSRVLREVRLPTGNLHHSFRRERCLRVVTVRGQKMLQLAGDWTQRVRDIFESFTR